MQFGHTKWSKVSCSAALREDRSDWSSANCSEVFLSAFLSQDVPQSTQSLKLQAASAAASASIPRMKITPQFAAQQARLALQLEQRKEKDKSKSATPTEAQAEAEGEEQLWVD